jgi:hypothetical protein
MIRVCVDDERRAGLLEFARRAGLELEFTAAEQADLLIRPAGEQATGGETTLYAGGQIECAVAWAAAGRLQLPLLVFGALLDHLAIKVRACCLGCFP